MYYSVNRKHGLKHNTAGQYTFKRSLDIFPIVSLTSIALNFFFKHSGHR